VPHLASNMRRHSASLAAMIEKKWLFVTNRNMLANS
jgi:hypothetical protein